MYQGPQRNEIDPRNPMSLAFYLLARRDWWDSDPAHDGDTWDQGYRSGKVSAYEDALRAITPELAGDFDRDRIVELLRAEGIEP